ncbi:hypothetical protein MSG28_003426, partial [Choristoneura fumiferana]
MMHQQSMMVGDMLPVHPELPVHGEEMNNVGYENSGSHAYDDLFPALPHSAPPVQRHIQQATSKLRVGSSLHTQVFHVPYEERKLDNANTFGEGESLRTCQAITKDTGAHIEISTSKDGSLTFLLTGKHSAVLDARRKILTHFQQQGQKLKDLEKVTATKISVPGIADNSEIVTITGTKEGIEKAEHEIRVCSEEQSRKAFERITVPKIYHPFIQGPYGERVAAISAETGARIHIPPSSTQSDDIVVAGEKNGAKKCSTVRVEVPKSQHKYVIGSRGSTIHEILKETGVSVEMPPPDSPTGTITLHGPHNKIGLALSKVCEKANSVKTATVDAPTWIHKYIIGKNGSNIKKITQDFSKVHVDMSHSEDKLKIDGPPEEVERAQLELNDFVQNLIATLTYVELTVDPKFFKHIIGKSGANINRLKDETGVVINIIENEGNNVIRIEGSHQGVADAERKLREMVMKLENERSKEVYVDHRYIKSLIGVRGDKIKEIREKFERVLITLPDQGQKRSPIKLRGPQEDIEKCEKHLHKLIKEIAESSYVQEVPIFKQFHKFIIGKGGANLRKIRDETQTQIDLPAEGDDSDVITVRGKRENVEDAVKRIQQIHNEKANVVTEEVTIAPKYYNSLIGAGGKLIHSIMEECGGVLIKFPPADSDSDKVVIKLLAHASERELTSHTATVRARAEHHKFLIGKSGANIKKIREHTGARIIFPTDKDEDKEAIFIIAAVADISNVSESEMAVAPRHHRHFVARRGEVLRRIADDCGGVQISFPRQGVNSDRVVLKGPKECIEAAKTRILEIIEDLEAKVTIECIIPQRHHRTVMGARGSKVKDITAECDVQIKFPERDTAEAADIPVRNGDEEAGANDVIRITGRPENCEAAKKALLEQVPITIEVEVPNELHRLLAGQKRRELMQTYDVHLLLPPNEEQTDIVKVTGTPTNVEKAKHALVDKIVEMEKEKEDRALRSFELKFKVDPEYHPLVIGKGGGVITKIRTDYGVQINLPKRGEPEDDVITIQGYEDKAQQAKDAILAIVHQLIYRSKSSNSDGLHLHFLKARNAWFERHWRMPKIQNVSDASERLLRRIVELHRIHLFNVLTQHKSIFLPDAHESRAREDELNGTSALSCWLKQKCMYLCLSFGRVGADMRCTLTPLFRNNLLSQFHKGLEKADTHFENQIRSYKVPTIKNVPRPINENTSSGPPESLLDYYPLAEYCNGMLIVLNMLRVTAPLNIVKEVYNAYRNSFNKAVQVLMTYYQREQQAFTDVERQNFVSFCVCFMEDFVPYISKCLSLSFPSTQISELLGCISLFISFYLCNFNFCNIKMKISKTIIFKGHALSKVCEKANSVKTATVDAPTWIHKYIIGKNGSNIKKITQDFSKVHVDMSHSEDKLKIDGPPEEVERAQLELNDFVQNLIATLTYVELTVDPKFFKHIIGKSGANINRLKDETGVVINIIENEGNNVIRIEGSHQGVADAERKLREMVMKLENERSKEVYVDHRYIKSLIGVRGDKIKEIREKFERVLITLPDQGQKRSPIKLRGPQEDIEKCEKHLHKLIKEIAESSYVQEVPIFKQFHKFIIGKGGANLRKIRDETQTQIDLPAEGDDSDVITVRGKRENVEDAVKRIQQIHNEKANVVTEEVTIAPKYYNSLIGAGGKLIHSIMEECGGVLIKFPPADSDSDKVVIKLLAHASERELTSHTATVRARAEHHKFLIGKSGANIKKIREHTGARIIFPTDKDEDKEAIFIIGREEQVEAARKQLEAAVADISNVSESEMAVAPRHHRHFVARRGEVLRRIADDCGGVQISFPRQGVNSDRVVLKGPKECIEAAKTRILEIIEDLEAKVTIECIIPQRHHRTVMGARGSKVKDITAECDVQIKFPERDTAEAADIPVRNGDEEAGANDVIRITGRPENCEAAKKALLEQVPITIEVEVPNELHRLLAGQKRRELMQTYDVHLLLPPNEEQTDIVKLKFKVDPEYHPLVIGKGGGVITKIRTDYGVQINLPKRGEPEDDVITIQGYEDKAQQAKDAILAIVHQ